MAVGGAALLLLARPTRGQQGPFSVQASIPATASAGATTEVRYSFPFPAAFQLLRNPRVRVTDAEGKLVELLPMYIDRRTPLWGGHRGLHTENYRPGAYRVTVEVEYAGPDGGAGVASSSEGGVSLTVP
jgi:hypothetical protein